MWLVCYVETGSEAKVQSWGLVRGHDVYLPKAARLVTVRNRRQRETVVTGTFPAFPGYLFAASLSNLEELRRAPGFVDFVQFGEYYGALSEDEVVTLRAREAAGGFNEEDAAAPDFQVGGLHEIRHGPMAGRWVQLASERSNGEFEGRVAGLPGTVRLKPEMLVA